MAKTSRGKTADSYRTIGQTYDGVKVLAPKTKSKTFTAAEVRQEIQKALKDAGITKPETPLRETDALRVQKREDGRFEVKRPGAKRASDVKPTQKDAIERAKELDPNSEPIVKRVRKSSKGKRGTWRKP